MALGVLIVEDEIEFRNYLTRSIEWDRLGFVVVAAVRDVDPARAVLNSKHVDLVLLDITLQQSDGLALMDDLAALEHPPRVIVITGHNEFATVRGALRSGVDDYLLKPFAKHELVMSILANREFLLERARERRESASLDAAMVEGWLNRLFQTESPREAESVTALLYSRQIKVPAKPRVVLCSRVVSADLCERALVRWLDQLASMWRSAVENLAGLVWVGFEQQVYATIGGAEASELEWESVDLATEFVRHAVRHLPVSVRVGISRVDDRRHEGIPLRELRRQAVQACERATGDAPVITERGQGSRRPQSETPEQIGLAEANSSGALAAWHKAASQFVERFHHDPSLDVQTVAAHLGISTEYLRRAYHACAGSSCVRAIMTRRIEHARALLDSTRVSIAEVARRAGFSDPAYFARQFKRLVGITPSQYRRSGLGDSTEARTR